MRLFRWVSVALISDKLILISLKKGNSLVGNFDDFNSKTISLVYLA